MVHSHVYQFYKHLNSKKDNSEYSGHSNFENINFTNSLNDDFTIFTCKFIWYHVMSCYMSCNVRLCHIMSCHATPCYITCHVKSCHIMSCHVMLCCVMSYCIISCHAMSYYVMSCNIHSSHTVSLWSFLLYSLYIGRPSDIKLQAWVAHGWLNTIADTWLVGRKK